MNLPHKESTLMGSLMEGEGTFFRTHALTIQENISKDLFAKFCTLTTNQDRIAFMYNLDIIHSIELPSSPFKKNVANAMNYKNQGNSFFKKNNYQQAMKCYNVAIIECPHSEGILLSTLYANRSATLYHTQEYDRSLQDINVALSLSYPNDLVYKVEERKARCYLALNDLQNAIQSFKKAMPKLEYAKLSAENRQKKESDFNIMITLLTKSIATSHTNIPARKKNDTDALSSLPNVAGTRNKQFPNASHLVEFLYTPKEGRFATAHEDIEPGQVLVVEKAHCANLLFQYCKTHCQHCFVRVSCPVPCEQCPNVIFCSIQCQKKAMNTYHKYECHFLGSLWTCGSSLVCSLAIRLLTQRDLQYFLNIKSKLDKKLEMNEKYDTTDYRTVYNLCHHADERTHIDFFQRTVMAIILLRFLQQTGFFPTEPTKCLTDHESYIGSLILHNLQLLQFNAHEIAELQFDTDYPNELDRAKSQFIGGGLFPTVGLFNHSCEPGIVRYFSGSRMIVRSVKPIRTGEIIAENYGPIYTQISRDIRKVELKQRYWFDCNCTPCVENWPVFDQMKGDVLPFRCVRSQPCPGVVSISVHNSNMFVFPCPECDEKISIFNNLKSLNDTEKMFAEGESMLKNRSYKEALQIFIKIMKILDRVLKPPFKDFCLCQQKIRSSMLTFGNIYYT